MRQSGRLDLQLLAAQAVGETQSVVGVLTQTLGTVPCMENLFCLFCPPIFSREKWVSPKEVIFPG